MCMCMLILVINDVILKGNFLIKKKKKKKKKKKIMIIIIKNRKGIKVLLLIFKKL